MSSSLAALAVLLAALGLSPAAVAQPAGEELDGLIAVLEARAVALVSLGEPSKPELKQLKFLKKQLARLNKPSDGLLDDAKALKKVVKPLQKKLAADAVVQQELVIAAALMHESCGLALEMLAEQFENYHEGGALTKAASLQAKGLAILAQAALTEPLPKYVALTAKAAKRSRAATTKLGKAQPLVAEGCFGDPLVGGDFIAALVDGAPWKPTSYSAWLTYAPDGVTVQGFSLRLYECPEPYRWVSYSLSEAPQVDVTYVTSPHIASPLSVSGSDDNDWSDGLTLSLYIGGVGIRFTHFDPATQTAVGSFHGYIPDGTPAYGSVPISNGSFSIQGFNVYVQPAP